jgi:hypothetical protein
MLISAAMASLTATDQRYDLQLIAVVQDPSLVLLAGNELSIQLDGDLLSIDLKFIQQCHERKLVDDFPRRPVDGNLHGPLLR